ncbi:MAG: apolipoprotein N-acyltransferase [Haliea sp.]|nr:MAG: apolipoprotein N-acyltransferase [Haliea sp.]
MRLPRLAPVALGMLAGWAQAVAVAAPWDGQPLWWLQLLSLALLVTQLEAAGSWQRAALVGWTFATTWLAATFWWLFISMHTYGGLAAPLAIAAILGLAAFLGSYYALVCGLFRALVRASRTQSAIFFAALWMLAELARVTWFTGFPWGAGGYAHLDGPLAPLAKFIGVHGIGALAAGMAVVLAGWRDVLAARRVKLLWVVPAVALLLLAARTSFSSSAGTLSVALLQGNIPQDEKFESGSGVPLALAWYQEQLTTTAASLVVAPETAIPLLPAQLPEGYLANLGQQIAGNGRAALIGIPLGSMAEGYSNAVIGIRPGADVYRYDKHHLVPFGEFIPPLFRWFTEMMKIPLGDFNRGAVGQPSFEWKGHRLAPNICYEDLFGEELGARFADPATAPTVFVNVSNIGWFGNTVAIDQHLAISRMRALEFERPMLRATNTGATVVIDHHGRLTHSLPRYTRGVLVADVEGRTGTTPYAWWVARLGLWPLWLLAALVAGAAYFMRTSRPGRAPVI